MREYLKLSTDRVTVIVKGKDTAFYTHTMNAYKGGLFMNGAPEGLESGADTSRPSGVPEQTDITINVVARKQSSHVDLDVRNTRQTDNRINDSILSTSVNFSSRIGVSLVDVTCDEEQFTFALDVCPIKISYDEEYYALIHDLQTISRSLAFDWLRSSSLSGSRDGIHAATDIEFLKALDDEMMRLKTNLMIISHSPSKAIVRHYATARLDRLGASTRSVIRSITQGKGAGPIRDVNGVHIHEHIPAITSMIGYDTPANRWLKQSLANTRNRVGTISRNNRNHKDRYKDGTQDHLRDLYTELTAMLSMPFLESVTVGKGHIRPSMEVLGRKGYGEAARIFDDLNRAFVISDGVQLINSRPIAELYEEWCYLKVAMIVSDITKGALDPQQSIDVTGDSLRIRFRKNGRSRITITANAEGKYDVVYNKVYKTLTGVQKPDIVIEVNTKRENPTVLVLDAKYRLTDKDSYGNAIMPQPPVDAINALHRYRDAIYVEVKNRDIRPVVKCVILYPQPPDQDENNLPYWESIQQVGIGAIPLSPGNDGKLREYLTRALDTRQSDFYKPGPSFEPYESLLQEK